MPGRQDDAAWARQEAGRPLLPPLLVASLVLLGGLLLTLGAWDWLRRGEQQDLQYRFDRLAERIEAELQRRLGMPIYGMHGARGLYAASTEVNRDEFRAYVDSRQLTQEFPGTRGFGFIERVMRADVERFTARMRAEAGSDFELQTRGEAADLYVIKYIEPLAQNRAAWGYDIGSEPVRREAAERAVRSGLTALSGPIALRQDARQSPGFLLLAPVYRRGADPRTPEQRERALVGLVYAPLVASEVLGGVADVAEGMLDLQLFVGGPPTPERLVFASHPQATEPRFISSLRTLEFGGSRLQLRIGTLPRFESQAQPFGLGWMAGAGVLLSAALALAAWLLASARARALGLAREMTGELDRLAHVARSTTNAVFTTDREQRISWINEGFTRITGYTSAEALGRTPGELLGSGRADPAALRSLAEAVTAGRDCRVEILNRRRDGSLYWVETELQPLRDGRGRLTGFIEISLDISERKRAAELLWLERERLNNIIAGTGVGTWEWNVQSGELMLNERWAGMLGYDLAELSPPSYATWAHHCHPEDLAAAEQRLQAHLRGDAEQYEAEMRLQHKDGRWIWVLTRGRLYAYTSSGEPLWVAGTQLDITERKRMEQELRASEALLERTGRIAGVGGWQLDLRSLALRWTEQTFRIHGLPGGQRQPGLEEALAFYDPAGRQAIQAAARRALRRRESADLELRLTTAQGRPIWVRAVGEPVFEGGHAVRIDGTLQDITERRMLEDSMRRSNEVLRSVLDNLPCALSVFDADLHLLAHNQQFRQLLDFPDRLFEGDTTRFEDIIRFNAQRGEYEGRGDVEATVERIVERARHPSAHHFERVRPNGAALEIRGAPMPGGGFVTTYIDISERKRLEAEQRRAAAELAQTLALLKAVLDSASKVAIIATDRQRRISIFNHGAEQMLGYRAEEVVGRLSPERLHVAEELEDYGRAVSAQLGQPISGVAALVHPSQLGREIECLYVRKDGSRFPALRVVTEMRAADGGLHGYLGVAYDITRQKESEASLQAAKDSAEQASQAKSQFLANMSHEIRTPMNAILGMLKLLQRTPLDARQRDYAAKTEGAARSLLLLLNDILDFSKIEAGKLGLDPQPFRPARLIEDLQVILQANLGSKPLALRFELDPALPELLLGDALRLQQVLINLGGNAIKFTEAGAVTVRLRQLERSAEAAVIEFRVLDSGIGIAPEHQQKIFAGFTQAEASTTRRFGGTGLGLSISQQLVQLMGGRLELRSAPGQGSEFFFSLRLPLCAAEAALPAAEQRALAPPARRLQGLRLLVVDDNPNNQQVARELLTDEGALVSLADDGRQALALLDDAGGGAAPAFDAVLMDVQMPVMDGHAATRALRARPALAGLPVIAMTANALPADQEASRAAGMDAHVGKPFEMEPLVALIRRLVGRGPAPAAPLPLSAVPALPEALLAQAEAAGLDLPGALQRLMGKTELFTRLSKGFVLGARALPAQLRGQLQAGALEAAASALHTFRGLAATLGARRLAELAEAGERGLKAGTVPTPAWEEALAQAVAQGTAALVALAAGLQETGPAAEDAAAGAAPPDAGAARAALQALMGLLRGSDMAALEALERLRRLHPWDRARLARLDGAMAALDFARALQYCEQMIGDLPP